MENNNVVNEQQQAGSGLDNELLSSLRGYESRGDFIFDSGKSVDVGIDDVKSDSGVEQPVQHDKQAPVQQGEKKDANVPEGYVSLEELPEDIRRMYELKRKGVNIEEYKKEYEQLSGIISLSDKDVVRLYYKTLYGKNDNNPNGLTDEDIDEELEAYKPLSLKREADKIRNELLMMFNSKYNVDNINTTSAGSKSQRDELLIKKVDTIINNNKSINEVFGIPVGEAEKEAINKNFKEWILEKNEKGVNKLYEFLSDDNNLYKIVALLTLGEGGVKKYISDSKESVKNNIINKIKPNVDDSVSGGGVLRTADQEIKPSDFL